jgi:hypothetical protein
MFKKTKKRCENIKNFGKTTFEDMKELKNIGDLDREKIGVTVLTVIAVLLPTWLSIVCVMLLLLLVYIIKVKHE